MTQHTATLAILSAATVVSACAVTSPSSVQFSDLTREIASNVATYEKWVKKDQDRPNPFPVGLCLERIDATFAVSKVRTRGASAAIPLAAPGGMLSGSISLSGSNSEGEGRTTTVPFVPFYLERSDDAPETADERDERLLKWRDGLADRAESELETWAKPPGGMKDKVFAADQSLAAELWRLRAAAHFPVFESALRGELVLRPESVTYSKDFEIVRLGEASVSITLAGSGSLGVSVERSDRAAGTFTISYVENRSLDPFNCDNTSLTGVPRKPAPMEVRLVK